MPNSTLASSHFDLAYDLGSQRLVGCWHGAVTEKDLYLHYAELMAAAEAHGNCRFWLLDMRERNWHTPGFGRWFGNDFAEMAHATLGQPLFIAYVLSLSHKVIVDSPGVQVTQYQCAAYSVYPFFFDSEAAALDWLAHQQAHDEPAA